MMKGETVRTKECKHKFVYYLLFNLHRRMLCNGHNKLATDILSKSFCRADDFPRIKIILNRLRDILVIYSK